MKSVVNARNKTRQKAAQLKLGSFGFHRPRAMRDGFDHVARQMIALSLRLDRVRASIGKVAQ